MAPVAARRPLVIEAHGDERIDDLALAQGPRRSRGNSPPGGGERLHRGRHRTPVRAERGDLTDEIKSRIEETDLSVPVKKGPWWYLTRTSEGSRTRSIAGSRWTVQGVRRSAAPRRGFTDQGPWPDEQVLLDENKLARPRLPGARGARCEPEPWPAGLRIRHTG